MTTVANPSQWLTDIFAALGSSNVDGFVGIFAEDAVYEFPFAPEGRPEQLVGKASIAAFLGQFSGVIDFGTVDSVHLREIDDELIIEATGHHHWADDKAPFESRYVWFITFREGFVTRFRDYINPLQFAGH